MEGMRFDRLYPKRTAEEREKDVGERGEQSDSFSEKWKRPEKLTTRNGEVVDLYDMRPKQEKTSVPVVMFGGWSANAEIWKKNMREFVARGRRAIMVNATHGIKADPKLKLEDRATDVEYRKISGVFAGLEAARVERADAVAHSEGCIDLLIAAVSYPERFRNIVLVSPAGMMGPDSFYDVFLRNQKDVPAMVKAHEAQKRKDPGYDFELHPDDSLDVDTFTPMLKKPARSIEELLSVANIQVADLLREVKEKGIGVVIVAGGKEDMFPIEGMAGKALTHEEDLRWRMQMSGEIPPDAQEVLNAVEDTGHKFLRDEEDKLVMAERGTISKQKTSPTEDIGKIVDGFYSIEGVHTRWFDQPVETTQLVDGALTALEAKRGKAR